MTFSSVVRRLWAVCFVCLMALSFCYGAWGIPWYVRHLTQLALALSGVLYALCVQKCGIPGLIVDYCRIFSLPYVLMLAYSMLCWALDLRAVSYITRGCSTIAYCLISLAAVSAAVLFFGTKAVDYAFFGMCLANLGIAAYSITLYGAEAFFDGLRLLAASGGATTTPASKALEVHDLTFAFGLMVLYYLLFDRRRGARRYLCAATAMLFFLLGWKFIGAAALVFSAAVFLLLVRLDSVRLSRAVPFITACAAAICFAYIYLISSGQFDLIVEALAIDTKGRRELYAAFSGEYSFSPLFRGWGIGYVTRKITLLTESGAGIFATHGFGGLHNDILTLYIELGFAGFAVLVWLYWHGRVMAVLRLFGRRAALLLICENAYVFVTYATDNTAFFCYVNTVFMLLPLALSSAGQSEALVQGGVRNGC